jgi:hypothetical protein
LTARQAEILRVVLRAGSPNLRTIADGLGSANRLRAGLEDLVDKRCLSMAREGNQHRFTITKTGLTSLAKHDGKAMAASIVTLAQIRRAKEIIGPEDQRKLEEVTGRQLAEALSESPEVISQLLLIVKMLEEASGLRARVAADHKDPG